MLSSCRTTVRAEIANQTAIVFVWKRAFVKERANKVCCLEPPPPFLHGETMSSVAAALLSSDIYVTPRRSAVQNAMRSQDVSPNEYRVGAMGNSYDKRRGGGRHMRRSASVCPFRSLWAVQAASGGWGSVLDHHFRVLCIRLDVVGVLFWARAKGPRPCMLEPRVTPDKECQALLTD